MIDPTDVNRIPMNPTSRRSLWVVAALSRGLTPARLAPRVPTVALSIPRPFLYSPVVAFALPARLDPANGRGSLSPVWGGTSVRSGPGYGCRSPGHIRRGTVGTRLLRLRPAVDLAASDHHLVDLVGAVGDPEHPREAPHPGQRGVVGHPQRTVDLDRPVEDVHDHVRGHHLDHRDLLAGGALAGGVHLPGREHRQQARLTDLHPALGDEVLDELLVGQLRAERLALGGSPAHH